MFNDVQLLKNPFESYRQYGFARVKIYNESEFSLLENFTKNWVYGLLTEWARGNERIYPLASYHTWSKSFNIDHRNIFCAKNRHIYPGPEIEKIIVNKKVMEFLSGIGIKNFKIWDEGLGWLGFRFIRPGAGDGYPFSRKNWGPAQKVVSCWIPIIGHTSDVTITLVPGSHVKEYKKYLPSDGKFMKGEYRLAEPDFGLERYNPELNRGEVIFYHPKMLHSEDVINSNITRLNLEYRIDRINKGLNQ